MKVMKEARIELKIKNNVLYTEIIRRAPNVNQFCKKYGFYATAIGALLNLKDTPWSSNSRKDAWDGWRIISKRLSQLFGRLPEDLFPAGLYALEKTEATIEVSIDRLSLSHASALTIESPEDQYVRKEALEEIHQLISSGLRPREHKVICDRFGIDEFEDSKEVLTLEDCAIKFNVTKERVRQIEKRAVRRLREKIDTPEGRKRYHE